MHTTSQTHVDIRHPCMQGQKYREILVIYRRYVMYRKRWIRYIGKIYHLKKILINISDIHKYIDNISIFIDIWMIQTKY